MNKEPSVLTRMRLSCCWGDNLNEKELNEVVDYINHLQRENKQYKAKLIEINEVINGYMPNVHAMCKAFDEIEFILSKEVE